MQFEHLVPELIASGRLRVDLDAGLIYSKKSNTPDKPLGALTKKGYIRVCLTISGKQAHALAHRVIWCAKHGPLPDGLQIDHINCLKTDNRISNLHLVDQRENIRRANIAGLMRPPKHGDHYGARLTADDVANIRRRASNGESGASIALAFGISSSHARRISRGERWSEKRQVRRVGKAHAGRMLDGREYNEFPTER